METHVKDQPEPPLLSLPVDQQWHLDSTPVSLLSGLVPAMGSMYLDVFFVVCFVLSLFSFLCCVYLSWVLLLLLGENTLWQKEFKGESIYSGSQFRIYSIVMGKSHWQELETTVILHLRAQKPKVTDASCSIHCLHFTQKRTSYFPTFLTPDLPTSLPPPKMASPTFKMVLSTSINVTKLIPCQHIQRSLP